jgi:hypothetical protein
MSDVRHISPFSLLPLVDVPQYQKSKLRAQELQARREAEIKREIAAKKEKDAAAAKEAEAVSSFVRHARRAIADITLAASAAGRSCC